MGNTTVSVYRFKHVKDLPLMERGVSLQAARDIFSQLTDVHTLIARERLEREPSCGEVIAHGLVWEKVFEQSFAEYLYEDSETAIGVGRCNVFLSHTWHTPFQETLAALEEYEAQLPNDSATRFYFIDYFAVNQFTPSKDLKELGMVARDCETLVLFAKPWNRPGALRRAWCIFELAHAELGGTELVLAMPPDEKEAFQKAVVNFLNSDSDCVNFMKIFASIETQNMEATILQDLVKIKKFMIEKLGGFHKVDKTVSASLRRWFGKAAINFCEDFEPSGTKEHADFMQNAVRLFYAAGMINVALTYARKSKIMYDELNMEADKEAAMTFEAGMLGLLGKYDEAIELLKYFLRLAISRYGLDAKRTLECRYNLGGIYYESKSWWEAEVEVFKSLEGFKKIQRPMSLDIRMAQCLLAQVLRDSGRDLQRAEHLLKEVLDYEVGLFGPEDVTVLVRLIQYARCLALLGHHEKALISFKKALPVLEKTYGEDFVHVQNAQMWMMESVQKLQEKK